MGRGYAATVGRVYVRDNIFLFQKAASSYHHSIAKRPSIALGGALKTVREIEGLSRFRTSFRDRERATVELFAIPHIDGFVGVPVIDHLNEAEAP